MLLEKIPIKKKIALIFIIFAIVLMVAFSVWSVIALNNKNIYNGIYIDGLDVSGLTRANAVALVETNIREIGLPCDLVIKHGDVNWTIRPDDISFKVLCSLSVEEAYKTGREGNLIKRLYRILELRFNKHEINTGFDFDREKLSAILENIKAQIDIEAVNADVIYENNEIKKVKETIGLNMDVDKNIKLIENQIRNRKIGIITLEVNEKIPELLYNDIEAISNVVAEFTTKFSLEESNRVHNIGLAVQRVNGYVLRPGEYFSMNTALGPRTLENGYREAPVIFNNEIINGSGGGVCQATSTLYAAVLKAELEVMERKHHSMPLGYIDPGQDATIAEDYIDLKFRNNKEYSVCISAETVGNRLTVRILGAKTDEDKIVKIKSVILEEYIPEGEDLIIDDTIPFGQKRFVSEARKGLKVAVFKEAYDRHGNLLESKKIYEDIYKAVKTQVKVSRSYYNKLMDK